ncbi:hypothetical protein VTJ04DRAFT_2848 [Mycothermus thermophilus]|uniref:uncharacterized protein n=1 Tax=Humicola insolens TaxID=85995 RepID=UPI003742433C
MLSLARQDGSPGVPRAPDAGETEGQKKAWKDATRPWDSGGQSFRNRISHMHRQRCHPINNAHGTPSAPSHGNVTHGVGAFSSPSTTTSLPNLKLFGALSLVYK